MKLIKILIILAMIWQNAYSHNKDSIENKTDWKFVAGVTLFSNNRYVAATQENFLERQPYELNMRYKFKKHHVLRFQFPFSLKVNKSGSLKYELPLLNEVMNGNGENKSYEIWKGMQADYFNFLRPNQYYYNLWGVSLGYDYDFPLKYNISIFGGVDLSYTQLKIYADYIRVAFEALDEENATQLRYLDYKRDNYRYNYPSIKPLLGCRFFFQKKLLIEGSIGYGLTSCKWNGTVIVQSYYSDDVFVSPVWSKYNFNQFIFQLSINYSF